ncbi:MAG TPA: sugar phosphate isomerase/epimerase [Flavobacteriia bacterium]|nr:sugar phosphate isomerase/epimerase [Flavobacteriia bacterium]
MKNSKHRANAFSLLIMLLLSIGLTSCKKQEKEKKEAPTTEKATETQPFFKLSLAQWSLHRAIIDGSLNPIDFAQKANEMGFEGLEYVSGLYKGYLEKSTDKEHAFQNMLDSLKLKSEKYGLKNLLIMIDGEGDLAATDESVRNQAIENHKKWVDAAAFLGCHSIRVNLFGNGNNAEAWSKYSVKSLKKLCQYGKEKNVNIIVENHGGFSSNATLLTKVIADVGMDNCGVLPDFGNFCLKREGGDPWKGKCIEEYDRYKGIEQMMPYAKGVSAKSYDFDENGNETTIDFKRMLKIIKDAGYTGFIDVEYEGGRLPEEAGIEATKALLLKVASELK